MKKGNCTECDKPLFDQHLAEDIQLCDDCSELCELCGGTGEVSEDVWDNDSHTYQPTGTKKCLCRTQIQDEE